MLFFIQELHRVSAAPPSLKRGARTSHPCQERGRVHTHQRILRPSYTAGTYLVLRLLLSLTVIVNHHSNRRTRQPSTMAAAPPGGTFFDNKRSFAEVPIDESKDNGISTPEFLEASEALTLLFDVLGSAAFKPVKSDMTGNITVRRNHPHATRCMRCENSPSLTPPSPGARKSAPATSPPPSTAPRSKTSSAASSKRNRTRRPRACSG